MQCSRVLAFCWLCVGAASQATAALTFEFASGVDATFVQDSGVVSLALFVRSDDADVVTSIVADMEIAAGVFTTPAGIYNQPNQVGFENISLGSSNFDPFANNQASLSLDFISPQLIPDASQELALLTFDITGLAVGTYELRFLANPEVFNNANQIAALGNNGSFTVTAVPEPSAVALLAGCSGMLLYRKRYKQRGSCE